MKLFPPSPLLLSPHADMTHGNTFLRHTIFMDYSFQTFHINFLEMMKYFASLIFTTRGQSTKSMKIKIPLKFGAIQCVCVWGGVSECGCGCGLGLGVGAYVCACVWGGGKWVWVWVWVGGSLGDGVCGCGWVGGWGVGWVGGRLGVGVYVCVWGGGGKWVWVCVWVGGSLGDGVCGCGWVGGWGVGGVGVYAEFSPGIF